MSLAIFRRVSHLRRVPLKIARFSTESCSTLLHSEWIVPNEIASDRSPIVFLHGLLGNSRNIKTMARAICRTKQTPGLLIDITGHGKSASLNHNDNFPATFDSVVQEINETVVEALKESPADTITLVGHSLGGRLSLHYAAQQNLHPRPDRIWLLDTVPGHLDKSVLGVLSAAARVMERNETMSRKQLTTILETDVGKAMSQWLAAQHDGKRFAFDIPTAILLVEQFKQQDFWGQLDSIIKHVPVHLIQGGANDAWKPVTNDVQHFASTHSNFSHHILPKAGHWVHIDDLPGLVDAVQSVEGW